MKIYVVGGAVRDRLMGKVPKDIDYVVVGADADDITNLTQKGFQQVGADFPVFLSPDGDEYALARKERKVAAGYHGFEVTFDATVTLEEDLSRRDLTMNSMAVPLDCWDTGDWMDHLIDPFSGKADTKAGVLRHTSDAFKEDPVRVLRIARFAARYPDFIVAEETVALCKHMADVGELKSLVGERVWKEFSRALCERGTVSNSGISRFLQTLKDVGAYHHIFPGSADLTNEFYDDLFKMVITAPANAPSTSQRVIAWCHNLHSEMSGDVPVDRFAMVAYAAGFSDETMAKLKPPSDCAAKLKEYRTAFPMLAKMYRMFGDGGVFTPDVFTGKDMLEFVRITRLRQFSIRAIKGMFLELFLMHRDGTGIFTDDDNVYRQRITSSQKAKRRTDKVLEYVGAYYQNTDFKKVSESALLAHRPIKDVMDDHASNAFDGYISNVM
jgi:tRNA nucleotidyltransferase/poly(A) polymerase